MRKIELLVKNARLVSHAGITEHPEVTIAVDAGIILEIGGESLQEHYAPDSILDAKGMYLFPGFINTHDHLFQILTKGLGKERPLWDWLENTIRQMTPYMDDEALYYAAMAGCMENLQSGVTTMLDFQYCHSHAGQFDAVCQAFRDCGIRGYVGRIRHTGDYLGMSQVPKESTKEYFSAVSRIHSSMPAHDMLDVALIAPGMPGLFDDPFYSKNFFKELRLCAEDLGIPYTQHLVETDDDDDYMLAKTGMGSVDYLDHEEFFGPRCILAHCVKIRETDYEIFRRNDVKVSHNPVSNMILASGVSPITRFLDEGICVSLGIDGSGSNDSQDMLETIKLANLLQKVSALNAKAITAQQTLALATEGGARALNRPDLGSIAPGKRADFFLYNPAVLKSAPVSDVVSSLVYCSGESNIHTVVVNGKIVFEDGTFPGLDTGKIIEHLIRCAEKVRAASRLSVS